MRRVCCVAVLSVALLLSGCGSKVDDSLDVGVTGPSDGIPVESALVYDESYTDTAFGKTCKYVDGETPVDGLACEKGEIQPDWEAPVDGWQARIDGEYTYIHQVYKDNILLLPLDYASNTYKIFGLDATENDIDCLPCEDKNDGGTDILN